VGQNALLAPAKAGPAERQAVVEQEDRAEEAARRRLALAQLATTFTSAGLTLREAREEILGLAETGVVRMAPGEVPSEEWIRRLGKKYAAGGTGLDAFRPSGQRGPPPRALDATFEEGIERVAKGNHVRRRLKSAYDEVCAEAKKAGVTAGAPSYATFRRRVQARKLADRIAAHEGSRAAELRAGPHGTIPARCTYDVISLDEGDAPRYYKFFDPQTGVWFSARPSFVLLRDRKAGALTAGLLADPTRRRDPKTGATMRSGFGSEEVTAAIVSMGVPSLARAGCRDFAGYVPITGFRLDRHATHTFVRAAAVEAAKNLQAGLDEFYDEEDERPATTTVSDIDGTPTLVRMTRSKVRTPKSRGDIENCVGFLKERWPDGPGHQFRHIPVDQVRVDDEALRRSRGASQGEPVRRVSPIAVEHLGTFEDAVRDFDALLQWCNHEHRGADGLTAAQRFRLNWSHQPRPGTDVLALLKTRTLTPQPDGISVQAERRQQQFPLFVADAGVTLEPHVARPFKVDPLLRALWVRVKGADPGYGGYLMLRPTPSDRPDAAHQARVLAAQVGMRAASDDAEARRRETMDAMLGPGAYAAGQQLDREYRAKERARRGLPPDPQTPTPEVSPSAAPPDAPSDASPPPAPIPLDTPSPLLGTGGASEAGDAWMAGWSVDVGSEGTAALGGEPTAAKREDPADGTAGEEEELP
jgi:hypothetical protein